MKSTSDPRAHVSKRTEDRTELSSHGDGKAKPSSWQRSVKRKLPPSACELPPQARKPDNTLCTSQNLRPYRQLACVRKSLSDPLQVFGDCDESNSQHKSFSGINPDRKDRLSKYHQGQHETLEDGENLSMEKRRGLRSGLKDSTNLDPKVALKQNNLHTYNEVMVLKETLRAQKEAHETLQAELDEERNAASSAANEAMSMIARLQEEKAAVLMEARQFKRMAEERELHNQEAISLLKEMLMNKEEEALALENELVACRQMFLAIETREPIQNMNLKYLDMENYVERNLETDLVSSDSKQLSIYAHDLSRGSLKEEPINSEFNGRAFSRSFKGFASDSIRGNLEDFFNRAGEMANCNDMQRKENFSGIMYDNVVDVGASVDVQDSSISFTHGAIDGVGSVDNLGQITPPSMGEAFSEFQAQPPARCMDEQNRSLWDRIMKLEHRLETFGVDGEGFEFDLRGNVAPTPQTPAFISLTSSKQQVSSICSDTTSHSTFNPHEVNKEDSAERPRKPQCAGDSHGLEAEVRQSKGSGTLLLKNQMLVSLEFEGRNTSHISEQPCEMVDGGVHDVFEVGYQSNQGSHNECYKSSGVESNHKNRPAFNEKPDSPSELMAPIMETMAVTPPDSAGVKNLSSSLSGAQVQQLNKRLQVLENEKHSMHQAILSLQAENKELRVFQGVAFQLQELKQSQNLKRSLQISELPNKRVKSEQSSFTSILKGFLSYLPSSTNTENCSIGQDLASGSSQKDYVGLSHLLENSPHLKTETLIVRDLKVRVPAAI